MFDVFLAVSALVFAVVIHAVVRDFGR